MTLNNGFTVTAGTPVLTLANPNTGQQGQQNLSVTITGQFTHFVQGSSTASFGAGIPLASPLTVNSATSATAVLNIDASAAIGARNVTMTTNAEVVTLNNGFSVTAGMPVLTLINPNTGQQGQQNLSVAITGQFTHFVQGTTTASFGAGIPLASPLTVNSATSATAVLNIDASAAIGARNVTMTTNAEVVTLNNGFTVTAGIPVLTTINPNTGKQGDVVSVAITGQFTNFNQSTTQVDFGAGITVGTVTVANATSLTAQLTIASTAALGARNVTVTTGTEVVTLNNTFSVSSSSPLLVDSDGDGLSDAQEISLGTDELNPDTDGDGFSDGVEVASGSDPLNSNCTPLNCRQSGEADSVAFSVLNNFVTSLEADSVTFSVLNNFVTSLEADSVTFSVLNTATGVTPLSSLDNPPDTTKGSVSVNASEGVNHNDADGDGLPEEEERRIGTDPSDTDSDRDGFPDGLEAALGSNPLDANSLPDTRPPGVLTGPLMEIRNFAVFNLNRPADKVVQLAKGVEHVGKALATSKGRWVVFGRFLHRFR